MAPWPAEPAQSTPPGRHDKDRIERLQPQVFPGGNRAVHLELNDGHLEIPLLPEGAHLFERLKQDDCLHHSPIRKEPLGYGFKDRVEIIPASSDEDPIRVGKGADRLRGPCAHGLHL